MEPCRQLVPNVYRGYANSRQFLVCKTKRSQSVHYLYRPMTQSRNLLIKSKFALFVAFTLLAPCLTLEAHAQGSILRVACEGNDVGAEVSVNGKFKGECPLDMQVGTGTLQLRLVKKIDALRERVFEQNIRMGDGAVKKVEAVLSAPQLNPAAQRSEDERLAPARAAAALLVAERQRRDAEVARLRSERIGQVLTDFKARGVEPGNGRRFKDCAECPEMLLVPAGRFMMGSADDDGKPLHEVTIPYPLAIGAFEVTFDSWGACVQDGKCEQKYLRADLLRGHQPVIDASWNDGQAYGLWLSAKTGLLYRLLSEAEWEYACRAGAQQTYCGSDNLNAVAWHAGNSGSVHPVGQKQANAWGLFDMSGNAAEWVQDCYHANFVGAPTDGAAWTEENCVRAVSRGGASYSESKYLPTTFRNNPEKTATSISFGLRIARTLP